MLIVHPVQRQTRHCWNVGYIPEYIYFTARTHNQTEEPGRGVGGGDDL